jgi:pimeloyl-ACP methyl ester carboxylesterase
MSQHVETAVGIATWYDEHGTGDPLVLLHGGMAAAESWGAQLPAFSERYRVLLPERRGHGHTADVDGPYTYEAMTDETVAFLEAVLDEPAYLVGWSDGGNVSLHVARDRPDLVRKLVVMGSNYHYTGLLPGFMEGVDVDPADPGLTMFRDTYARLSPDEADHWPIVHAKLIEMWKTGPTMTVDELATIDVPTLVMVGDDDIPPYKHTVSLFESLPNAQLAVIPGASHVFPLEKPALVNELVIDFLADGQPIRMLPMRFALET